MFWPFTNPDDTTSIRFRHFPSFLRTLAIPAALAIGLMMAGCDSLGEQQEEEPTVLRTLPSDQLEQVAEQEPTTFTWDLYAEELEVIGNFSQDPDSAITDPDSAITDPDSAITVQAVSIWAVGSDSGVPEIIDTTQTEPVTVPIDRLTQGLKTSELYSVTGLAPLVGEEQFPTNAYSPVSTNNPLLLGDPVDPQEAIGDPGFITNQVLGNRELGPDQAIVVTFFGPGGGQLFDFVSFYEPAPLGLILERQSQ